MPLTGDYGTLQRWADRFGELASGKAMQTTATAMAHRHVAFTENLFEQEQDPFGNRWAPTKKPTGRKVLTGPSGTLKRFVIRYTSSLGYAIGSNASYFKFHQKGTKTRTGGVRMVARRMLPGAKLPAKLASDFRGIYLSVMRAKLRR